MSDHTGNIQGPPPPNFALTPPQPDPEDARFTLLGDDDRVMLVIRHNGRIEVSMDDATEAARKFVEAMRSYSGNTATLDEIRAEAWDEGCSVGFDGAAPYTTNPYRDASESDQTSDTP